MSDEELRARNAYATARGKYPQTPQRYLRVSAATMEVAWRVRQTIAEVRPDAINLAREVGLTKTGLALRLDGTTPFEIDDLRAISNVLGAPLSRFLPEPAS